MWQFTWRSSQCNFLIMDHQVKIERLQELIAGSIPGELTEQKVTTLLPPGENYGSIIYQVDFKMKIDGEKKSYHAVEKCTPLNKITQEFFNTQETFRAEIGWYTTVIPTLKTFARDQSFGRKIDFFQEFYGGRISLDAKSDFVDKHGVILTENLKQRGFHNIDRYVGFDAPTTYSILKNLATFHALSMAIRGKNPVLYEKNLQRFCTRFAANRAKEVFQNSILELLNNLPEFASHMDTIRKVVKESCQFEKKTTREPWVAIVHQDFWLLDEGSPAGDVIFFLLTSIQFEVIKEKLDEFIKFYYDQLMENLEGLNLDTYCYRFDDFLAEIAIEVNRAEYVHALGHTMIIFQEKGSSFYDSSDAECKDDHFEQLKWTPKQKQIEKFRWISMEAIQRKWI
ncbi:hypothetical protein HUJ04_003555 [Dendroctonus ponderosae]|nr:hypothetical protein HUJ04_003555 [Dendroctonus ponderosae]